MYCQRADSSESAKGKIFKIRQLEVEKSAFEIWIFLFQVVRQQFVQTIVGLCSKYNNSPFSKEN